MEQTPLRGKVVLITGGSRRIGRGLALGAAEAGADVIIHCHESTAAAEATKGEIVSLGRRAWILQADFSQPDQVITLAEKAFEIAPMYGLVNNAAVFAGGPLPVTTLADWDTHMKVNLTAPFLLSQAFGRLLGPNAKGRIVNLLDWRALRPGIDHFSYTISKAGLAAMTQSLALSLAPNISVNGLALGAILPPGDGERDPEIVRRVPAGRWGDVEEVVHALTFLLAGPEYVTGEIIYLDGGRHLV
ncbi:MAG TPA: SDR family NAD(P)-dependent oxidoreductase [Anaerolineales bacterium]